MDTYDVAIVGAGSDAGNAVIKAVPSAWNTDPWVRGGYSSALPGKVPARAFLADTPLAEQVFFAGEATVTLQHSSVHGAYLSGQDAAKKALQAL